MLVLLIIILVFAAGFVLPWWCMAVICFIAALLFSKSGKQAFGYGFTGVFAAWVVLALLKSIPNHNVLADRIAQLFFLPNWVAIMAVAGIIGGIVGGIASLSGYYFRQAFVKEPA